MQANLRHELHVWSQIDRQIATAEKMAHMHAAAIHVPDLAMVVPATTPPVFAPEPAPASAQASVSPPRTMRVTQIYEPVPAVSEYPTGEGARPASFSNTNPPPVGRTFYV